MQKVDARGSTPRERERNNTCTHAGVPYHQEYLFTAWPACFSYGDKVLEVSYLVPGVPNHQEYQIPVTLTATNTKLQLLE